MNLLQLLGSFAGVLFLAALAWGLRLGEGEIDQEEALAEAAGQGFDGVRAERDGAGWRVIGANGEKMRLDPLGARFILRPVSEVAARG